MLFRHMILYIVYAYCILRAFLLCARGQCLPVDEVLLQAGAEEFHTTPRDCDFEQATMKICESHPRCIRCLCDLAHCVPMVPLFLLS